MIEFTSTKPKVGIMRVARAFGFVDLCGFTAFTDEHGDEQAVAVLARFRGAVREACSRNGVRVAKWLGDGVMFVSVSTPDLVLTLLELERWVEGSDLPLRLRGGAAAGDVILFDGEDYIGGAVNLASRLCDAAQPGELLANPETAAAFPVRDGIWTPEWRAIPGIARPVRVVRALGGDMADAAGVGIRPAC